MFSFLMGKKYFKLFVVLVILIVVGLVKTSICKQPSNHDKYENRSENLNSHPLASGRMNAGEIRPYFDYAIHNINNIRMLMFNDSWFGYSGEIVDPIMGDTIPGSDFPIYSGIFHLFGAGLWVGGVVGRDSLVSTFAYPTELNPDKYPEGKIIQKSIRPGSPFYADDAVSEQDFIAVFYDTLTDPLYVLPDEDDIRTHRPLNIEITMKSYAWSFSYVADFILYNFTIKNISLKNLKDMYIGLFADGDIWSRTVPHGMSFGADDDLCGFIRSSSDIPGMNFPIPINSCYFIDNDGDPFERQYLPQSPRHAGGIRILKTPVPGNKFTFNWWGEATSQLVGDFGPRRIPPEGERFRRFGINIGYPPGDANKYFVMSQPEFDYDQVYTAIDHTMAGWMTPPIDAVDLADGVDCRVLLSSGPFDLDPGFETSFTIAWFCGENVHNDPTNFEDNFNPYNPNSYLYNLDFSDFALNALWASWIYDNPGYDSNNDGYKGGSKIICVDSIIGSDSTFTCLKVDTVYYSGDGIPDFRAAVPPPPPQLRVSTGINNYNQGYLNIRWNGLISETTPDIFSGDLDFEGYRLYLSLSSNRSEFAPLCSYDFENYNRYCWSADRQRWLLLEPPFTIDALRNLYGFEFDPLSYDRDNFLTAHGINGIDSFYYFERQDWNYSNLLDTTKIYKRFPEEPYPSTLSIDSAGIYYPEELTEGKYFKYFEYEYTIENLLPSREYYVSVTAFDYGSPGLGLESLESDPLTNMVAAYAQNSAGLVEQKGLQVIVYPNPYRIDGNYRGAEGGGFEGQGQEDMINDRVRAIHFSNLPHKCTISIFSIDGDLIRKINHDYPVDHPQAMHDCWDVITRNTQLPVSGIYYYVVESAYGSQIGKLVLIM